MCVNWQRTAFHPHLNHKKKKRLADIVPARGKTSAVGGWWLVVGGGLDIEYDIRSVRK